MNDIKIQDRKQEIEFIRMACNMVGVYLDYKTTDLMLRAINEQKKLKGKFNLEDAARIETQWQKDMSNYHDEQINPKD